MLIWTLLKPTLAALILAANLLLSTPADPIKTTSPEPSGQEIPTENLGPHADPLS